MSEEKKRGRPIGVKAPHSTQGMKAVSVRLSRQEYMTLFELARVNRRSAGAEAAFILTRQLTAATEKA